MEELFKAAPSTKIFPKLQEKFLKDLDYMAFFPGVETDLLEVGS